MKTSTLAQLLERRAQICIAITEIKSMRRGTFNEVYRKQELKSGAMARRGPFYNITMKTGGNKTVTTAVPKKDVGFVRQEVENYRNFRRLSDEYIDICENISLLVQSGEEINKA